MKHITPFFQTCQQSESQLADGGWSQQKISNVHSMLQVVRTLVSPSNASQVVAPAQKATAACGLLSELCGLLMASGVPADILSEIICTVGEMIRGYQSNQELFGGVMAATLTPPRTALVILLMSMVNEKQPMALRSAVLYCFQCFVYRNESSQAQIVQALLPTSPQAMVSISAGQLLCGGLFSSDSMSHWLSSVALSHALVNNVATKEMLLRVHLAMTKDAAPVSLLQQTFYMLQQGDKIQTRLGILTLLSTWLAECPGAVAQFLKLANSVAFLTAQVASNEHDEQEVLVQSLCAFLLGLCVVYNNDTNASFTKESLCQLITKRIGVETFVDKLTEIAKQEMYSRALKHPHIGSSNAADVHLDHEFCRLYKALEGSLAKAVAPATDAEKEDERKPSEAELKAVALVREKDLQIQHLLQRLANKEADYIAAQSQIEELNSSRLQLEDQNMLLKAQRNNNVIISSTVDTTAAVGSEVMEELERLRQDNERLRSQLEQLEQLEQQEQQQEQQQQVEKANGMNGMDGFNCTGSIMDSFQVTAAKPQEMALFSHFRPEANAGGMEDARRLQSELKLTRSQLECLEAESMELNAELVESRRHNELLAADVERNRKDQEDLLVLLADQDSSIQKYKDRLRNLNQSVSDEEEEDEEDHVCDGVADEESGGELSLL